MSILRIHALILLFWIPISPIWAATSSPILGEELEYTLTFRGLITGYVELKIAKLTLGVAPDIEHVAGVSTYVTRLRLTTEPYTKAEMIYPLRLDYRSWLTSDMLQPLLATKRLQTRESKRELLWFDRQAGIGYCYKTGESDDATAPEPESGGSPPQSLQKIAALTDEVWAELMQTRQVELSEDDTLDYMGLLHQLRHMDITPGETLKFTVFTGKKFEYYRAKVARERLVKGGWDRPALRLKLFEYDPKKDKLKDEIRLWLSDDEQRLLLRFYAERAIGALEGILESGRPENGRHDKVPDSTERSLETYLDF